MGELEHVLLKFFAARQPGNPRRVHVNVASRAGAGAATISLNAWDRVVAGSLHNRLPDRELDLMWSAAVFDVDDLDHFDVLSLLRVSVGWPPDGQPP